MKAKNVMLRGLLGAPLGVFIGYTITILSSVIGNMTGDYYPVVPQLASSMGSEISAVTLQYILSALLGFASAAGSAIFEVEEWGITKRTILHFLIVTISMFPIAYICHWMEHTVWGILSYIIIFVTIYILIWGIQVYYWKKRIKKINQKLEDK